MRPEEHCHDTVYHWVDGNANRMFIYGAFEVVLLVLAGSGFTRVGSGLRPYGPVWVPDTKGPLSREHPPRRLGSRLQPTLRVRSRPYGLALNVSYA